MSGFLKSGRGELNSQTEIYLNGVYVYDYMHMYKMLKCELIIILCTKNNIY